MRFTSMEIQWDSLFEKFSQQKIAVVGDVMLDSYLWGNVERISPEAPVPIVTIEKKENRIGGAGNVALNTVAMGAATTIFSVIGNDDDGKALITLFNNHHINSNYLVISEDRITTSKTRIISRNQQMMRLDAEMTNDILPTQEEQLFESFEKYLLLEKPDVVVLEDYNKGVLTENVISKIIGTCNKHNIITTVDPKRKNFFSFKGATLFKPNLKEVKDALNVLLDDVSISFLQDVHSQLHQILQHSISLITLSEKGVFYSKENNAQILPGHIRNIADVSGAGDTVIAVASLAYAATKNIELAASIANLAGGLVCEEVGTAAINKAKLLAECKAAL